MFGSQMLEVGIGIVFIYLGISLLCTSIAEFFSMIFSMRAKNLEEGIRNLLNDSKSEGYAKDFYNHPLIKGLAQEGKKPSYIPSRTFALVLMDIIFPNVSSSSPDTFKNIEASIKKIKTEELKKSLGVLVKKAATDIKTARENIEEWFNDAMERVSGWYKRKAQGIIFILALVLTVFFNADTIMITNRLAYDATMRTMIVEMAEETSKQSLAEGTKSLGKKIDKVQEDIKRLKLPILGWSNEPDDFGKKYYYRTYWFKKNAGLWLTVFAVSLGAPFWFDVLGKLIRIRQSGLRPKANSKEKDKENDKGKESKN